MRHLQEFWICIMPGIEACPHPLVFPVAPCPAALELPSSDTGQPELGYRCATRALHGMQKEAVVGRQDQDCAWRMVCDEGPYLNGSDLAPFPLAFFCTGMVSSYLTELLALLRQHKVPYRHLRLLQDNRYTMEGSATAGTMKGGALPVELQLAIDSPVPADELGQYLVQAVAASPVGALLRQRQRGLFSLHLNGSPLALPQLEPSPHAVPPVPLDFDQLAPARQSFAADAISKLLAATRRADTPGGIGSSLLDNQRRVLHMRGSCQPRADGLLETVVELYQPLGSRFRFLCDPVLQAGHRQQAPDSLAYLSAGIAFCYMTQLGRYAHILKRPLDDYRLLQDTRFGLPGASGGTGQAGSMQAVLTAVHVSSQEDPAYIQTLATMGEQTCFLHAACRDSIAVRIKPVIALD